MKKILLAVCLLAANLIASAQIASGGSTTFFSAERQELRPTFGIRAGLNMSTFTGDGKDMLTEETGDSSTKLGFNFGVAVDLPIMQSLYVQSGLYVTQKGFKTKDSYSDEEGYWEDKLTYKPIYLQLPILASYRYNFNENTQLQINFGPYLAFGIAGKYTYDWSDNYRGDAESGSESADFFGDETDGTTEDDEYHPGCFGAKRFDAGIILGAGVTFNKIYVGFQWEKGLTEIIKDSKLKNSNVCINVGYNF